MLLLSPIEFFGEVQARLGPKLTLRFHLAGFPYLSGKFQDLCGSLKRMISGRGAEVQRSSDAKSAIGEWTAANGREAQDLIVAAVLETVRRNDLPPSCALLAPKPVPHFKPRLELSPQPHANNHHTNPACPLLNSTPSSHSLSHHPNTIQFA
jgi:hypothetical protein